jgi:hypothetical protein
MSVFHCSCGFAIDNPDEFGDHLHQVFARDDNIGMDGHAHVEVSDGHAQKHECTCGFAASGASELDDHLRIAFITLDGLGTDGKNHVPWTLQRVTVGTSGKGIDE